MSYEYSVGFNSGSLVDMVSENSIKELYDADDYFNTASDGEIEVKSSHPNISKMLMILKDLNTSFYDENQDLIESDEIENKIKTTDDFVLFICELEVP